MKVGIQLYSVRQSLAKDAMGTLKALAKMGYKYWETAQFAAMTAMTNGYGLNLSVEDAQKFLADNDVKVVGAHVSTAQDLTKMGEVYAYHAAIGNRMVGITGGFFDDKDDLLRKCELYNKLGEDAKTYGVMFYYHSHFHEFQKFDGEYVMDILLANTEPELVGFELDTYWAQRGGMDPVSLIEKYKSRLKFLHQKDIAKAYADKVNLFETCVDPEKPIPLSLYREVMQKESFAEVGTGIMDIQPIIDAGNKVGVPYILLEQDWTQRDEMESVQMSMDAFRRYSGIEWA
jgi:sugar phosphate isomerase/epimerase